MVAVHSTHDGGRLLYWVTCLTGSEKKIILVTGPPGNGRDEYISRAVAELQKNTKVVHHHVFAEMQRQAPSHDVLNLTRENIFGIAKSKLERIRNAAYTAIIDSIRKSENQIEIVSTPAVFKIAPWGDYLTGRVDGITREHLTQLSPTSIIVFIDDLLRVREALSVDPLWKKQGLELKDLAEWRHLSIEIVQNYADSKGSPPFDWTIFARDHAIETFEDLLRGEKHRIYISYHITGQQDFADVERFTRKLGTSFVCIDPLAIKDWSIVTEYDKAVEGSKTGDINIEVKYRSGPRKFADIPLKEIEDAIASIRTQIVERDFQLIASAKATVVYHKTLTPSYGVMSEMIHSVKELSRPVYVLYPFKTRPSPFFEQYVRPENLVSGPGRIEDLEDEMLRKLVSKSPTWPTIVPSS
jgi:adenylate kinase